MEHKQFKTEIKRINGYLKEVITFFDSSGKPISHIINPLMVELRPRDVLQIFIGALLMGTPLCFTEEVWVLSSSLKIFNISLILFISLSSVSCFVYFNFYRNNIKGHIIEFFKRIVATYVISILSIVVLLFLIDKFPILENPIIALKRIIIIGFPAVFAGTLSDSLK